MPKTRTNQTFFYIVDPYDKKIPSIAKLKGFCLRYFTKGSITDGAIAYLVIAAVFVGAHPYFFAISLSGNIERNRLPAWAATSKGKLCSNIKAVNRTSALIIFLCDAESGTNGDII